MKWIKDEENDYVNIEKAHHIYLYSEDDALFEVYATIDENDFLLNQFDEYEKAYFYMQNITS